MEIMQIVFTFDKTSASVSSPFKILVPGPIFLLKIFNRAVCVWCLEGERGSVERCAQVFFLLNLNRQMDYHSFRLNDNNHSFVNGKRFGSSKRHISFP